MSGNHILNFSDKKILFRIRAIACPYCEVGQTVHKADAYQVYKTYKYANPKRKKKPEGIESSSYYLSIEEALLSPKFIKRIKPPPEVESIFDKVFDSNFYLYSIIGLTVIAALTISIYLERLGYLSIGRRRKDPQSALLFFSIFINILVLVWLLDKLRKTIRTFQFKRWNSNWYCLQCEKHFIEKID